VSRAALVPLFAWLSHTVVGQTIRSSAPLIALVEIIHLLGLTMLLGTVLMVDMALMGFGIRRHPVARIAAELTPWTTGGLALMLISGPLILSSEALKCYESSFFWAKMAILLVAITFHLTVHRRVARSEPPAGPFRARLVAWVSLGLWIAVALAGKMVGIYGDDLRTDPAPFQVRLPSPIGVTDVSKYIWGGEPSGTRSDTTGSFRSPAPATSQVVLSSTSRSGELTASK